MKIMKRLLATSGAIAVLGIASVFVVWRDVDTSKVDFRRDVSAQLGHTTIAIDSDDPVLSEVQRWIQASDPRWRRSFTSYAPKLIMSNAHFSLNLLDHSAVLNFQPDPSKANWIQVVRECDTSEIAAIQRLRAKIEEVEQGVGGYGGQAR